jgi:hypothetical protein
VVNPLAAKYLAKSWLARSTAVADSRQLISTVEVGGPADRPVAGAPPVRLTQVAGGRLAGMSRGPTSGPEGQ